MRRTGKRHLTAERRGAARAAALGVVLVAMLAACSPGSEQAGSASADNPSGNPAGAPADEPSGASPALPPSATGPGAAAGAGAGAVHPDSGALAEERSVAAPPLLKVGETAQVKPLAITLLKVAVQPAPDGEQKHWALKMEVGNRGGERYRFLSTIWLRLQAPDGRRYRPSRTVSQWAGDPLDGELAPGGVREGWVGFAAPLTPGVWTLLVGPEGPAEAAFRLSVPEEEPPPAEPEPESPVWRAAERGSPLRRRITNRIWT